jgi:hypothetical protein
MTETHFIVATGGYLNDEVKVQKLVLSDEDQEFLDEFDDFGEYVTCVLREALDEWAQKFATAIVLGEDQIPKLFKALSDSK